MGRDAQKERELVTYVWTGGGAFVGFLGGGFVASYLLGPLQPIVGMSLMALGAYTGYQIAQMIKKGSNSGSG